VELGCGTGLNFPLLQEKVGPEGGIIGVDLTDAMLDRARHRVDRVGWRNVELVQSDAAAFSFPHGMNGVLSTFALTLVPEYDDVIRNATRALVAGGRMVVLDLKRPEGWPEWLVRLGVWLTRPFGVTLEMAERHPWESMARHLTGTRMHELYGGFAYLSVGEAPRR
jgi:demethylmenaquinone methyltransferase/2-methoxy-6-polyprenyl-1,4-benzoquinol methylase